MNYKFRDTDVVVKIGYYPNGRPALSLIDVEDGMPYCTCTINLPEISIEPEEVIVKDYSENEGVLKFLLKNNIVSKTGKKVAHGWVVSEICALNPVEEWVGSTKLFDYDELA
jgi:hypothetical protein